MFASALSIDADAIDGKIKPDVINDAIAIFFNMTDTTQNK